MVLLGQKRHPGKRKRDAEVQFQCWLNTNDEQHAVAIEILNAYLKEGFSKTDLLVRAAGALSQVDQIGVDLPTSSGYIETMLRTIQSEIALLKVRLEKANFSSGEHLQDLDRFQGQITAFEEGIMSQFSSFETDDVEEEDF